MTTTSACLFCRIINAEIAADVLYCDDELLAIRDIDPKAPVHILIIPVQHSPHAAATADSDPALIGHMVQVAGQLAADEGVGADGYRLVFNTGAQGGQSVGHTHLHLLGGRAMGWPPG